MKKITLFAFALLAMSSLKAQNNMALSGRVLTNEKSAQAPTVTNQRVSAPNIVPSTMATIFSEDFAGGFPAAWVQFDSAATGEVWAYTNVGPLNASALALASSSAANGWMMFDDDGYGNDSTFASASLITPAIDCSSNSIVFLTLQEHYRQYVSGEGVIYVSNDSITWTPVHNAEAGLDTGVSTVNPFAPVIDITAYAANQATVYLKFTYRGNWDYYWQIDDIEVYEPSTIDVNAFSVNPVSVEYTQLPRSQANNLILSGAVRNGGTASTSGGTALFEVIDSALSTVAFSETVNLPVIAPLTIDTITTTNPFTPAISSTYFVRMTVTLAGDVSVGNDSIVSATTLVTDSIYARDNGVFLGALGIGAGPADGIVGQNFLVNGSAQVTSVSFFLTDAMSPATAGSPIWATIRTQAIGSEPGATVLASSDTMLLMPGGVAAGGQWFTLPVRSVPTLTPGLYFIGMHEADSLLTLATSDAIQSPNAVWASWNTIPTPPAVNGWAPASDLIGYNFAYQLRLNFGDITIGINNLNTLSGFEVYPNPTNGMINVSNSKNDGSDYSVNVYNTIGQAVYSTKITTAALTTIDLSSQPAGVYQVKISNNSGSFNQSVVISGK